MATMRFTLKYLRDISLFYIDNSLTSFAHRALTFYSLLLMLVWFPGSPRTGEGSGGKGQGGTRAAGISDGKYLWGKSW